MASWIEGGGVAAEGRKCSRAASTSCRFCSKKSGRLIGEFSKDACIGPESRGFGLAFGFEGFGNDSTVGFPEENFDFAFGFFELLLAFGGKSDAFLEQFHRIVEGKLRAFEFADHLFEAREAALKIRLFRRIGFFRCGCVHAAFLRTSGNLYQSGRNSLRQGGERKQVGSACRNAAARQSDESWIGGPGRRFRA